MFLIVQTVYRLQSQPTRKAFHVSNMKTIDFHVVICCLAIYPPSHLPLTLSINASFRHFVSQSIVKMISLFMRNVCQMYLTDASVAYTPCLPTCSTVETSYIHTYLYRYTWHPHPHIHTHTVEFGQHSQNCEINSNLLEFCTSKFDLDFN